MEQINRTEFNTKFPELDELLTSLGLVDEMKFSAYVSDRLSYFNVNNIGSNFANEPTDSNFKFYQGLFIAHIMVLHSDERYGGDYTSTSVSSGSISVSTSRLSIAESLTDPYLNSTKYGAQLAFLLRSNSPFPMVSE